MGLFDGLVNQQDNYVTAPPNSAPATPTGTDPIIALLATLLSGGQKTVGGGGVDLGSLLKTMHQVNDPVGYANKMTSLPSYAPGSESPFNTGFFRSHAERVGIEQDRLGTPGITGLGNVPNLGALLSTRLQGFQRPVGTVVPNTFLPLMDKRAQFRTRALYGPKDQFGLPIYKS